MNFKIFKRLIALPLTSAEMAFTSVLAYHVQQDGNSCFPCYKTIHNESGMANKTISKVKRTLKYAGILDCKHRASPLTGKESNEYFFIFEGIKFYRDGITKSQFKEIDSNLKVIRKKVVAEMKAESKNKKAGKVSPIPSQMLPNKNSQNVNNDVCNVAGLEGDTIPSQMLPIPSQMLRRSNRENVQPVFYNTNDTNKPPCNEKKQKTVLHDKDSHSVSNDGHDSNNPLLAGKKKKPSEQSIDEWLNDHEMADHRKNY